MPDVTERLSIALAGRYKIESRLGEGGMATVYLAEDLKHKRKVALKVLKPDLAAVLGAERFVQEIRTTASLQHPHILPLFDSGTAGEGGPTDEGGRGDGEGGRGDGEGKRSDGEGRRSDGEGRRSDGEGRRSDGAGGRGMPRPFLYYVMPYIEGETLRDKLDRETQLSIDEAVRITTDVADALDYAHRHGVIHRDIKPENILLHDGRPVVADFGIALAVSAAAGGRMTETGLSLGTPHYMSPEQATAEKDLTARSDVYSLASVLYEMLTGDPPHTGSSAQQVIMKIVTEDAAPVTKVRKSIPPNVAAAVAKGLEKLPADRFEGAGDFALALGDRHFATAAMRVADGVAAAKTWGEWLRDPRSWTVLFAAFVLAGMVVFARAPSETPNLPSVLRFTIRGPVDSGFVRPGFGWFIEMASGSQVLDGLGPSVSPDNRYVAFSAIRVSGPMIYVRALDAPDLFATTGERPFFSPASDAIAFFRASELWAMSLEDRVPGLMSAIPEVRWDVASAVWHPDGRILVTGSRGLWAIPEGGGNPTLLVPSDSSTGERFNQIGLLEDGRILLNVLGDRRSRVLLLSADATDPIEIVPGAETVTVVEDILVFLRAGQFRATRFDPDQLAPVGNSIVLPEIPYLRFGRSIAWMEQADSAFLEPVWVTRNGEITPVGLPARSYRWPRVSPDGRRIAIGPERQLLVVDVERGGIAQLDGGGEPVWSSDGTMVFTSMGNRPDAGLVVQVSDGSRAPDTLLALDDGDSWPTDASADGQWLAYYGATLGAGTASDITDPNDLFFLNLETLDNERVRLPGAQRGARFSRDGRWVAYQSTETGREEVHVRPFPAMDANFQVSSDGGTEPIWSRDGGELYYRRENQVLAVPFTVRNSRIERVPPSVLFEGVFAPDNAGDQSYDLAPDGRFVMLRPVPGGRAAVEVVLNWIEEVRARLDRAR